MQQVRFRGRYVFERWSPGGVLLARQVAYNDILNGGLDDILNKYFRSGTPPAAWYIGLIGGSSVTIAAADTMSSHAGWTEDQNYSESTRQQWSPNAASDQQIDNSTRALFTINADTTIRGLFIVSNNTKGGTTGTLWSAADLPTAQSVMSGEPVKVFYDLTATGA